MSQLPDRLVKSTLVEHCFQQATCTLCGAYGGCKVFRLAGTRMPKLNLCLPCSLTVRSVLDDDLEDSEVKFRKKGPTS